ncbi:MAG: hypothetical protein NC131_07800 [Roseburia sp.]|nr:hypothetical protein [Roseburia sp.]
MKTFSKCVAAAALVAALVTAAGCSGSSSSPKVATTANWNVRTSVSVEKNDYGFWQSNREVSTYAITFTEGTNSSYKVVYNDLGDAFYTTAFYMTTFDWASDRTIEAYRAEESETEPVYVYETSLKISGYYQIKPEGAKLEFSDELITECYFRPAGNNLQPVYSYQRVKNTSPAALSTGNINAAVVHTDEEFYTYYNKACTQATVKKTAYNSETDRTDVTESEKKIGLSGNSGYSNFDNSQIRAAIRAFTLTGGATRTFNVLSPQNGSVSSVSAKVANPVELDPTADALIINALTNAPRSYVFFDGSPANSDDVRKNVRYSAVSLGLNAPMQGSSPTLCYSTVENADVNSTRCLLLKMSTPLSFGVGTLNYTLKTLTLENIDE